MEYITPLDLGNAKQDARTIEKFNNDPIGKENISRLGRDVSNLATIKAQALEAAASAANLQVYLSYDSPSDKRMVDDIDQPIGTAGRVTNDSDPAKNGDYTMSATGWAWSEIQPASVVEMQRVVVRVGDTSVAALVRSDWVPLSVDERGSVLLWLENGLLSGQGLGESLSAGLARAAQFVGQSRYVPLMIDDGGSVPLWLENGLLGAIGLTPSLQALVAQSLGGSYAPRNAPLASKTPRATDGRTLFLLRAALSRILASSSGVARVMLVGDSWAEQTPIAQSLADLLYADYGKSGEGFVSVQPHNKLNGVELSRSGSWSLYDASNLSAGPPQYGCGIDGHSISATGTNASLTLSNVSCTDFKIFYSNQAGAFRYQVDGGPWTTVEGTGDGSLGTASIAGLTDTAHEIKYDTSVNTSGGVVAIHGHWAGRPGESGVEVHKAGNGGQTGTGMLQIAGQIAPFAEALEPHVVLVVLGTNDYRQGRPLGDYRAALEMWIEEVRNAVPGCGFVFMAPPQSNAVPAVPLPAYRDVAYDVAMRNGCEFISLLDEWGAFDVMNSQGQWLDDLHPSVDGGQNISRSMYQRFFKF